MTIRLPAQGLRVARCPLEKVLHLSARNFAHSLLCRAPLPSGRVWTPATADELLSSPSSCISTRSSGQPAADGGRYFV